MKFKLNVKRYNPESADAAERSWEQALCPGRTPLQLGEDKFEELNKAYIGQNFLQYNN